MGWTPSIERMLIIFNVEPPIGENIGKIILQRCLRVGIHELFLVSTHYPPLLPMVALLVPLGTFSPLILLFFHLFGFITTQALTYISFTIAPIISNFPEELIIVTLVTNNTVVVTHFA